MRRLDENQAQALESHALSDVGAAAPLDEAGNQVAANRRLRPDRVALQIIVHGSAFFLAHLRRAALGLADAVAGSLLQAVEVHLGLTAPSGRATEVEQA